MQLKLKFTPGDKVWVYVQEANGYLQSVVQMYNVHGVNEDPDIHYEIKNPLYEDHALYDLNPDYTRSWTLTFAEADVFATLPELKQELKRRFMESYKEKLSTMKELKKKGWFNR